MNDHKLKSQAVDELLRVAQAAEPFSDIHRDHIRILDQIYNWSQNGSRWVKLFECGTVTNAMQFSKMVKDLMNECSVLGASQLWSNGRVFIDFWDEHRSNFHETVDKLHDTHFEFNARYASKKRKKAFIRVIDIAIGDYVTFVYETTAGEIKNVSASVIKILNDEFGPLFKVSDFVVNAVSHKELHPFMNKQETIRNYVVPLEDIISLKK